MNYFKHLKNILIDNSMNVEFNLWKSSSTRDSDSKSVLNTSSGCPAFEKTTTDSVASCDNEVSDPNVEHSQIDPHSKECIDSIPMCSASSHREMSNLSVTNVLSESSCNNESVTFTRKKNGGRGRPRQYVKKNRFHCGVLDCLPCSTLVNCGICTPCQNRSLK